MRPVHSPEVVVVGHLRELGLVDVALICVPVDRVMDVSNDILQQRVPIVECARLEGHALEAHYEALGESARRHRVAAVLGAGWDPGALALFKRMFEVLIPRGHTDLSKHPGLSLHHTAAVERLPGVKAAFSTERRGAEGQLQRYVYVQLHKGEKFSDVEQAIRSDPLHAGEQTWVFPVPDTEEVEGHASGVVLDRQGTATRGAHQSLLLEARFEVEVFAARVMLDAVRRVPYLKHGAHRYSL
jgi:diaminopimelate dehydrogenase